MNIEEILDSEKRNEDNLYDIHFYMEGSFWRAYEWSAYLSKHFPSELTEDERLKPTKKITKTCKDWYVHIGLPLSSFEKYFPDVLNNNEMFRMENKHIIIHSKSFFVNEDFSNYEEILTEWKSNIKLSDKEKKKNKEIKNESYNIITSDSLINEIMSYPIENKTLIESLQFLGYIMDKAIKIRK